MKYLLLAGFLCSIGIASAQTKQDSITSDSIKIKALEKLSENTSTGYLQLSDSGRLINGKIFSTMYKGWEIIGSRADTLKTLMMISRTNHGKPHVYIGYSITRMNSVIILYLDNKKRPLKKNKFVWMSKPLKYSQL